MKQAMVFKFYIALALAVAAVLSPLSLSVVPVILLAWFIYQWWRPLSAAIETLTHYFLYFALALIYSLFLPSWLAALIAVPILVLVALDLPAYTLHLQYRVTKRTRRLTGASIDFLGIALISVGLAAVLGSLALLVAGILVLLALGIALFLLNRQFPSVPVESPHTQVRILAGQEENLSVGLQARTPYGGLLFIQPVSEWVKVESPVLAFKGGLPALNLKITPPLSGNAQVNFDCYATDRWGLLQVKFNFMPVDLLVIPRARYADWLARRYLSGTKPGALPLLANLTNLNSRRGLRQGIEYYGNRRYQPGDSIKNINWKYSTRYNELITKEFTEFQGQPAMILADLTVGNDEDADRLAYNLMMTALTLVQNEIPSSLAAFDSHKVVEVTGIIPKSELVLRCLQLVKSIEVVDSPRRTLNRADTSRLRSNIRRIDQVDSPSAKALADLLRLEYQNLSTGAKNSPCTLAVSEVMARSNSSFSVILISEFCHNPEALSFNASLLDQKGFSVIQLD